MLLSGMGLAVFFNGIGGYFFNGIRGYFLTVYGALKYSVRSCLIGLRIQVEKRRVNTSSIFMLVPSISYIQYLYRLYLHVSG